MTHTDDPSDDELGARLRRAVQALPDAPPAWQRRAVGLWATARPAPTLQDAVQSLLTRVAAVLAFDSWAAPMTAAGMRSMRSPTRQLLFSAGGRDIDLRIAPAGPMYALAGQVLGPDESGRIELARVGGESAAAAVTALDALGEFRIEGLAPGTYALTLRAGGEEVQVPPFDIGEPAR